MSYKVSLHPDVVKYLDSLQMNERKKCYNSLKCLKEDPYHKRSSCDIKKLEGKDAAIYRLRTGRHRFLHIIKGQEVLIEEGFIRGKGY